MPYRWNILWGAFSPRYPSTRSFSSSPKPFWAIGVEDRSQRRRWVSGSAVHSTQPGPSHDELCSAWRTEWNSSTKQYKRGHWYHQWVLTTRLSDSAIPFLGLHLTEIHTSVHQRTRTRWFKAAAPRAAKVPNSTPDKTDSYRGNHTAMGMSALRLRLRTRKNVPNAVLVKGGIH